MKNPNAPSGTEAQKHTPTSPSSTVQNHARNDGAAFTDPIARRLLNQWQLLPQEILRPKNYQPNNCLRQARAEYLSHFREVLTLRTIDVRPVILDTRRSILIGQAFEALPTDARCQQHVIESFTTCGIEIESQYQYLLNEIGINFEFVRGDQGAPYPNSAAMMDDLAKNKHLKVFTGGEDHPFFGKMSQDKNGLSLNDKFRAVHDAFGHAPEGNQFGPGGEENAFAHHSVLFSDLALPALTTELRGQNSWLNFGPHMFDSLGWKGHPDHPNHLRITARRYAVQKVALLPDQFSSRDSFLWVD